MSKKYVITRLTNRKPISIEKIKTEQKDDGVFLNYHETIISQIVDARENKEFEVICSEIQKFIEKENIDACFVINKTELIDCLQEHQKLKLQISDLEAKLAESEEKCEELKQSISKCTEKLPPNVAFDIANDDIRYQIVCNLIDRNNEYRNTIKQLKQQLAEKDNTITALIEDSKASKELLKEEIAEKEKELEEINREFVQSTHDWKEIVDEKIKAKTEFTIKMLERAKDSVLDISNGYWRYFMKNGKEYMTSDDLESCLNETIDTIIKELEGK